jgi:uncharacterized membrane protein
MFATRLAHWLDVRLQWTFLGFGVKGAEALLQATVTATLTFLVFTFASLLVAIQVASVQLTPRVIATTLLRNDVVRYIVGLFRAGASGKIDFLRRLSIFFLTANLHGSTLRV